jgi:hypothetical protein
MDRKFYMILDQAGVPLWYIRAEGFPAIIKKADNNHIYTLASPDGINPSYAARGNPGIIKTSINGTFVSSQRLGSKNPIDGHSLELLKNGDKVLITVRLEKNVDLSKTFNQLTALDVAGGGIENCPLDVPSNATVAYPEIRIVDKTGKLKWYWDSKKYIKLNESLLPAVTNIDYTGKTNCIVDLFHATHAALSPDGKTMLLTTRFTSSTYGIDTKTKEILWKVGGTKTTKSLMIDKDPLDKEGPRGHHGGEIDNDNNLLLFDNRRELSEISRGVIYKLDFNNNKAVYQKALLPVQRPCVMLGEQNLCSSYSMGGADYTMDKNIIVSWGFKPGTPQIATLYDKNYSPILTIENNYKVHSTYKVTYLSKAERFSKNLLRKGASSTKTIKASWTPKSKSVTTNNDIAVGSIK